MKEIQLCGNGRVFVTKKSKQRYIEVLYVVVGVGRMCHITLKIWTSDNIRIRYEAFHLLAHLCLMSFFGMTQKNMVPKAQYSDNINHLFSCINKALPNNLIILYCTSIVQYKLLRYKDKNVRLLL